MLQSEKRVVTENGNQERKLHLHHRTEKLLAREFSKERSIWIATKHGLGYMVCSHIRKHSAVCVPAHRFVCVGGAVARSFMESHL